MFESFLNTPSETQEVSKVQLPLLRMNEARQFEGKISKMLSNDLFVLRNLYPQSDTLHIRLW